MHVRDLPPRNAFRLSALLAGFGFAVSAVLTARALDLAAGGARAGFDPCSVLFASSCDAALGGGGIWLLHVPLAGWGLVYFTTLAGLLLLARCARGSLEAEALLAASLLTLPGVAAGVALTAWSLARHIALCPLCLSIHAIGVMLALALHRASPEPPAARLRRLREAWRWLVSSRGPTPEVQRLKLVALAAVALLAALAYQWVYVEATLRRGPATQAPKPAEIIAAYRAAPWNDLPVDAEDAHTGPLTAPVRLVVFESFRCPGCRKLAGTLSRLRSTFHDRLLIAVKHYPLSTQCNERLTRDMQPGACEIAWAAEAANHEQRFWPFHDAIFAAGGHAPAADIVDAARRLHLDPVRFAADETSEATRARVAADIALGNRLRIPGTPAVFLDGRIVPSADDRALEILIRHRLERSTSGAPRNRDVMDVGRQRMQDRPSQGG